jgi:hypothetical protein
MKSKELIKQLQELDPTGETEVVVGCQDIWFADRLPFYYDGTPRLLLHDESKKPYYSIIGYKPMSEGYKIKLHTMSPEDIFMDNLNPILDLSEVHSSEQDSFKDEYNKLKKEAEELEAEIQAWKKETLK